MGPITEKIIYASEFKEKVFKHDVVGFIWGEEMFDCKFCVDHHTNAYAQMPEINPFSSKVICGECGHLYSRVKYTDRYGKLTKKWRCGSTNKVGGRRVCKNRYILEDALTKLFVMGWNGIAENPGEIEKRWEKNMKEGNELLRYKTKQIIAEAKKGPIKEFDAKLMIKFMDHITVFESGKLVIEFFDGTVFECETE